MTIDDVKKAFQKNLDEKIAKLEKEKAELLKGARNHEC